MTRREYRSPTGKLLGYSQTDKDRTKYGGKLLAWILGISIAIALLKSWLGF
jgi:hypothetical protein